MSETIKKFVEDLGWKIKDYSWDGHAHLLYVEKPANVEEKFEKLRLAFKAVDNLSSERTFPMLRKAGDEYIIVVLPQPSFEYFQSKTNLYLLIATIFTTTWAGSMWWASYVDSSVIDMSFWWLHIVITPKIFIMGFLTFSLPLMAILGTHEMGHYYYAKKHNLDASLPFFLPMPPMIFPFGTMGAFISIREPIPNKKALLDVGASGPIAGLLVAIPITLLGFWLTEESAVPVPIDSGDSLYLGSSIVFEMMFGISESLNPSSGEYLSHPVVLAGWTGFFVTALNLMPAGQLDGGHIARAMLGPKANGLSFGIIALLILMTFYGIPGFGPPYLGWAIYAILIFFLGTSHPPPSEEISNLDKSRIGVGVITGLILLTTFTPSPIYTVDSPFSLKIESDEDTFYSKVGESNNTTIIIFNNGETWDNITVSVKTLENVTVELEVLFVNITEEGKNITTSHSNFSKYVWKQSEDNNSIFNLTSGSKVGLMITATQNEVLEGGQHSFDLQFESRTEEVNTLTFYMIIEEKQ